MQGHDKIPMEQEGRMKHPFTGDYIKMVSAALEVQGVKMDKKIFNTGDYVIFESAYIPTGSVAMIDEHSGNIVQDNALVWLPQLHQIMDLFGNFTASLEAIRSGLGFPGAGAPNGYFENFRSWEECALAVLMLKRAGKVWSGKEWTKSDLQIEKFPG
jgi:hypothetical protein